MNEPAPQMPRILQPATALLLIICIYIYSLCICEVVSLHYYFSV